MLNLEIFKAYDIRGIYGQDFDTEGSFQIGQAYACLLKGEMDKKIKVGVGMDMRTSSPEIKESLIKGLIDSGLDVVDFGLVSSPAFYFAISRYGLDGGIMVSASHNPKEWNGFKIVRSKAAPVSSETGLKSMRNAISENKLSSSETKGEVTIIKNVSAEQLQHDLQYINLDNIRQMKVVVDTANGMGAQYILELAKHLPIVIIPLNLEFDGTFPAHEADPLKEENLVQLQQAVIDRKADLGIATDGDGDRIFFVDNLGRTINPAIVRALLSKIFLADKPGSKIGYDVRPGKITKDIIEEAGGIAVLTKVGHSLIKEQMLKEDIFFAGESSGHFYLNLPIGCFEMPNIIIGKMLKEFSDFNNPVSEYIQPLQKYYFSGEINRNVSDKEAVLRSIADRYSDAKINYLDGISVEYPEFWFNVRASNTENKIRLNLEAINRETMEEQRDKVLSLLQ